MSSFRAIDTARYFLDPARADRSHSAMVRGLVGSSILRIAAEVRAQKAQGRQVTNLTFGDFDPAQFTPPPALLDGEILLTSMDRDGTKNGFDLGLTRAVSDAVNIPVIASGGVGNLDHLADGVSLGRADAVLAASIFHFGDHTVREAKELMRARGIEVRL